MDKITKAVSIFNNLAEHYQSRFMDVSLYGDTFDDFCHRIKTNQAEILEIACGPGNITRYLLNKRPDFKITGIDLAPNMISLAKKNNPEAVFQVMDAREISTIPQKYDAIMCGFCLPYLTREETTKLISDAYNLLKKGGVFYISTIEDDYEKSGWKKGSTGDEIFMHFYSGENLISLLEQTHFEVMNVRRKEYPGPDGNKITDVVIISAKSGD